MRVLEKLSNFVGKYMAYIVIVIAAIALFVPTTFSFLKASYINPLLMIVMFGMGLTLKLDDFKLVLSRPLEVLIGFASQFAIMPLIALSLVKIFNLPPELAVGVVLVGTCPGGTSSNVMTFLAKGDVALSVTITSFSTLFAPILTPFITKLLIGATVEVDVMSMFISIVQVVIVPIALGFVINKFFGKITEKLVKILPLVSVTAIVAIVATVVSLNSAKLMTSGLLIIAIVILHNSFGYLLGFFTARVFGLSLSKQKTIAIEVGMQNSGLATSLAATAFAQYPLATIPGAIFSVWHNISGAIIANFFAAMKDEKEETNNA
ncbi:bile acid:sodium symporter family protein [Sedimentibacter hydroxybenzoicus DSM 7310]|uniref:Bile acid:sodium symporter family protein n=1 Tax=Sedimentibacter hydroxybenzoicus DSM 7310 TaxID=1123245 RepID=A0A974GWZ5_SEDHY|nr:bile acid:sodium symporter family protein [Sedimentibacter hydroxybenzoicus]NYB74978.1 bile acid:sodium symporter family protein [Sedimentibacter hydroxybenzoicus DSM 7310]